MHEFFDELFEQISESEATYLLWIDCHTLHPFLNMFCKFLREKKKLLISDGTGFGKNGEDFFTNQCSMSTGTNDGWS